MSARERRFFDAQAVAGADIEPPVAYRRKLGSQRLISRVAKPRDAKPRVTSLSFLKDVNLPEIFRLAEDSLRAVVTHVQAQLVKWGFTYIPDRSTDATLWQAKTYLAAWHISRRENLVLNLQVLNKAYDEYKAILQRQEPVLMWATYDIIVQLLKLVWI